MLWLTRSIEAQSDVVSAAEADRPAIATARAAAPSAAAAAVATPPLPLFDLPAARAIALLK